MRERADLEFRFPARAGELAEVRRRIREVLAEAGVSESICADVVLAVDEACQNIIRHCYGEAGGDIVLRLRKHADALEIELTDFGPTVDPAALAGRDLDDIRPGGLGIHLIRSSMDEVFYEVPPAANGNTLCMLKRLR